MHPARPLLMVALLTVAMPAASALPVPDPCGPVGGPCGEIVASALEECRGLLGGVCEGERPTYTNLNRLIAQALSTATAKVCGLDPPAYC